MAGVSLGRTLNTFTVDQHMRWNEEEIVRHHESWCPKSPETPIRNSGRSIVHEITTEESPLSVEHTFSTATSSRLARRQTRACRPGYSLCSGDGKKPSAASTDHWVSVSAAG
jgi:hypothetical protein